VTTLRTVLTFVQDETGSMHGIADQTISGFNEYFQTLKDSPDIGDVQVLVWQFSDVMDNSEPKVRPLYDGPLAKVPQLTADNYRPRGNTPLLDAVGTAIKKTEAKKADRYMFVVQPDGLENASRDFNQEQIAKLVAAKEASPNWTMVFLGAGINNWAQHAQAMGVMRGQTTSYARHDTELAYASLAGATAASLRTNEVKVQDLGEETEKELK